MAAAFFPPNGARPVEQPSTVPFLARFATRRAAAPSPRGETSSTRAIETSDE